MPRHPSTQPTDVELQILQVLWREGPSPVRTIHRALAEDRDTNYSTTVKMLSVMLDKGWVRRDEAVRPHVYRAAIGKRRAQRQMTNDFVRRVFDGSATSLVLQALSSKRARPEELAEIRRLLDQLTEDER